ncbi:MAG: radical SAM family heme chaperone HemW [Caldilineaceae bacterium]
MASVWKIGSQFFMSDSAAFGIYIHIPFCERKCPYCDFNTYAGLNSLFQSTVDALCQELRQWSSTLAKRPVTSIFLGGGTPTVLESSQLAQLFETIYTHFQVVANAEITSEANPGTVDQDKFATLRSLGVNRLSLGVQSLQAEELRFLGRIHSVEDVYRAIDAARGAGFDNLNLDFMFGLPEQSPQQWSNTLDQALALQPEHLSLYSLIVESNTPLAHWVKTGVVIAPNEDIAAEHYEYAIKRLQTAGYRHYEVSNWARQDKTAATTPEVDITPRLASQHNLLYWRNGDYLGVGPGAHSHLRWRDEAGQAFNRRWGNRKAVAGYVQRITQGEPVEEFHEEIDERTSMGETMMLGLRLIDEGVSFQRFRTLHGEELATVFSDELTRLEAKGLLANDKERVHLTSTGLMIGNQVFMEFL